MTSFQSVADIPSGFWRWPHIDPAKEWACHGDGTLLVVPEFMDRFEDLRTRVGFALPINSGYRSPAYNLKVASSGDDGPHTTGQAADIRVSGHEALIVLAAAMQLGFMGLGLQQKGPQISRYIHLDTARLAPALWTY